MGTVYVYKLGDTGIYKVGKTTDLTRRRGTYETISTEPLVPYTQIETTNEDEVETFIKHRLQSRRWLGGKGRELYEVDAAELDDVVAAAAAWNDDVLPKMASTSLTRSTTRRRPPRAEARITWLGVDANGRHAHKVFVDTWP